MNELSQFLVVSRTDNVSCMAHGGNSVITQTSHHAHPLSRSNTAMGGDANVEEDPKISLIELPSDRIMPNEIELAPTPIAMVERKEGLFHVPIKLEAVQVTF